MMFVSGYGVEVDAFHVEQIKKVEKIVMILKKKLRKIEGVLREKSKEIKLLAGEFLLGVLIEDIYYLFDKDILYI